MQKTINRQSGFAALISAILVSAVLLVLAAPLARAAFWARFEMLARENKKISAELAQGCANLALLNIPKNIIDCGKYGTAKSEYNIVSDVWEITARANWKNSYTNLKVTAKKLDRDGIEISEWREF